MPSVKIEKELYEKAKKAAELAGYSSVDEFVTHILEDATKTEGGQDNDEELLKRLKGLGYIS
jgi:hypothetical protein